MSTDFGSVRSIESPDDVSYDVTVTRFYGGHHGVCAQVTIGSRYVQLDKKGIKKLRKKLKKALS